MSDILAVPLMYEENVYYDRLGNTKSKTYARNLIASLETAFDLDSNYERNYLLSSEALMGLTELQIIYGDFETLLLNRGILDKQKGETLPIIKHIFDFESVTRGQLEYASPDKKTHEIVEKQFIKKIEFIVGFKKLISKLYYDYEKDIDELIIILEEFFKSKNKEKIQYKEAIRQQKKDDRKASLRALEKRVEKIEERKKRRAEKGPTLQEIEKKIGKLFAIKDTTRTGEYFEHGKLFFKDDDFRPRLDIQKYITLLSKLFGRVISDIRIDDPNKTEKEKNLQKKKLELLTAVAYEATLPSEGENYKYGILPDEYDESSLSRWALMGDYKYGILPDELYTIFKRVLGEYKLDGHSEQLRTKLFNRYYEVMGGYIDLASDKYDKIVDNESKIRELLGGQRGGQRKKTFRKKKPLKKSGKTKRSKKNRKTNKKK